VTDSNSCTFTDSSIISEPLPLTASTSGTDATCNGLCDGSASVSASGGTAPYAYQWDDPGLQTNDTATGLCAGIVNVTITDFNGCIFITNYTVVEPPPVSPPTGSDTVVCFGEPTPDLIVSGTFIQWYDDPGLTILLFSGDTFATGETAVGGYTYYVTQTISGCESPADTVVLTINPGPVTPTGYDTAICFGYPTPDLIASGNIIQWYDDIGLTNLVFTGDTFATGQTAVGTYPYYVTDSLAGCPESSADTIRLLINASPPAPTVSDTIICFGEPTPVLIATGDSIRWYSDSLLTILVYSGDSFASGDTAVDIYTYYVTQTDTALGCESPPDTATLIINPVPAAPNGSDTTICFGDPTPDLTATGINIKWYDDAGLTNLVFTGSPFATGDTAIGVYIYYVTDSVTGCTSPPDTVTLTIDGLPLIALSDTCIDLGSAIEFTTNTDTLLVFNTGCDTLFITSITNSSGEFSVDTTLLTILPGDTGQIIVSFSPTSDTSFADTLNIFSNDVDLSVCLSGIGLGAPVIAVNQDTFNVSFTGCCDSTILPLMIYNNGSAGASDLLFTVSTDSSWISFSIPADTVAQGDSTILNVTFNGCGLNPGIYTANITINSNDPLNPSDTVFVMVVKDPLPSSPTAPDTTICFGSPVPDLVAAGTGDSILWYGNPALTLWVFTGDTFATGDTAVGTYTYYITSMKDGCEGLPDSVTLTINTPPPAPIVADTSVCYGYPTPDLVATGTFIKWYSDAGLTILIFSGDTFPTGDTAVGTTIYYVTDSTGGCLTSPADSVILTIIPTPAAPAVSPDTTICYGNPIPVFTATGAYIRWYDDSGLTSLVFTGDTFVTGDTAAGIYTYYVTQTDTLVNNCESFADTVVLTINANPSAPAVADTTICFGNPTPDLVVSGTYIQWYDDTALTNLVFTGDTFATGETSPGIYTYYVTDSVSPCAASPADTVTLTINAISTTPTGYDTTICFGDPVPNLTVTGAYIQWYIDTVLTILVFTGDTFVTGDSAIGTYTYYVTDSTGGCPESSADTVTLRIDTVLSAPLANDTAICFGDPTPDLTATGVNIRWYSDPLLDTLVFSGDTFTTGDIAASTYTYYVTQTDTTANNCESPADTVILTINPIPAAPAAIDTTSCEGSPVPGLTAAGIFLNWYSDTSLTILEFSGDTFATGQTVANTYTYYVTQTVSGCESPADTSVLTIMPTPLPPTAPNQTGCEGSAIPDLTATGIDIKWYSDPGLTNLVNTGNTYATGQTVAGVYIYYVTDSLPQCVSAATTVTLTINSMPAAPTAPDTTICFGDPTPDLTATGTNPQWYSDPTLILLVNTGNTYTTGETSV
ncbi:DUF1573 domain-containing protein, partial [bacterium AH-315-M05]|nr:DUF1573 domain-containing protein [bacterium AH-315-M05]